MKTLDSFLLILRGLCAYAIYLGPQATKFGMLIAKGTGLRRTPSCSGNLIPANHWWGVGPANHGVKVDNHYSAFEAKVDVVARRACQRYGRQSHSLQMDAGSIIFRDWQIVWQDKEILGIQFISFAAC